MSQETGAGVTRRDVDAAENRRASRGWWDQDADSYQEEHGAFLGDVDFCWCPEGLREAAARLLGDVSGRRILEVGCGMGNNLWFAAREGCRVSGLDAVESAIRFARAT